MTATTALLVLVLALLVAILVAQAVLLRRRLTVDLVPVVTQVQGLERSQERTERGVRDEVSRNRTELVDATRQSREELAGSLKNVGDTLVKSVTSLNDSNQQRFETLRQTVEQQLQAIQKDNSAKLDQIRATVDEKLQGTLEKRLGESFKLVSERLEQVAKGLGEMQSLATGVGDLKRVLTNVKTRGTWGEVQLGAMLEQVMTPEQYGTNVQIKDNNRVEFAIKLPGRSTDKDEVVWLPIDAKFPVEDYQRLLEAQERADVAATEQAARQLEVQIKSCAQDISEKYLVPPKTTDFGVLYLPTEGLFAEVLRRTGLAETLQTKYRVVVAGPTTLWSLLNSLQMGFRTLAIEQRSSEVWQILSAVKTEWGKYGEVLAKVQKKLLEASNQIETAERRSRAIGRKLKNVQELPEAQAPLVLQLENSDDDVEPES